MNNNYLMQDTPEDEENDDPIIIDGDMPGGNVPPRE